MSPSDPNEPNPPSRKEEDFPKTNTIPDGWIMDALMEVYNRNGSVSDRGVTVVDEKAVPVPTTGETCEKVNGKSHPDEPAASQDQASASTEGESLFTRRLEPFPSAWDLSGMWL
jgi:hypothetical protein